MEEIKLKHILTELYSFEPSLKDYEAELVLIINKIDVAKPDTKFDQSFAEALKFKILNTSELENSSRVIIDESINTNTISKLFNYNFMNKKIYITAGSLAALSLIFIVFINYYKPQVPDNSTLGNIINPSNNEMMISKLPAGAFGSLANLSPASVGDDSRSAAMPLGMGSAESGSLANETNFMVTDMSLDRVVSSDMAMAPLDKMSMIMPYYGYKYSYVGDELNLSEETLPVYRRLKGHNNAAIDLAKTLKSFGFSDLNLSNFDNLQVTNLSVAENKELGLLINFDFNEESVYVYENWRYWQNKEREACNGDMNCFEKFRLTLNDIPSDEQLISLANNFLEKHKISLTNYSTPRVDNNWREDYNRSESKQDYYIPEILSVVYPLLINGEEVRDQSGNFAGLRVSINVSKNAVNGLNGLFPYRYEASDYATETSVDNILKIVENGGWNQNYYLPDNVQTLNLGTPTRAYVQLWRYDNASSQNNELLVPSLIFPIVSENSNSYYSYQRYVIVPLVKEILDEIGIRPDIMPMLRDDVVAPMPPVMFDGAEGTIPGSGVSAPEGEYRIMPVEIPKSPVQF